jgi:hypothetical protein
MAEQDEDQTERTLSSLLTDAQIDWQGVTSRTHSHIQEKHDSTSIATVWCICTNKSILDTVFFTE